LKRGIKRRVGCPSMKREDLLELGAEAALRAVATFIPPVGVLLETRKLLEKGVDRLFAEP